MNTVVRQTLPARAFLFSLCLFGTQAVHAVSPEPVTPGGVRQPFVKPGLVPPSTEKLPGIEQQEPARDKQDTSRKIQVNRFEISGNTAISTKELIQQVAELQGQELSLEEIYAAADILTEYYRGKGYSLARVVVPAQRVSLGIIELSVVEGSLNAIKVEGTFSYETGLVQDYFQSVAVGQPVNLAGLERDLLLLNDLPGLTSRALIKPGPVFGTSDLIINAEETRYQGRISLNNYGRVEVGEWRLEGEFIYNNLTGIGDQLTMALTKSEQGLLTYANIGYNFPINNKGTRIGANFSYIDYNVGGTFGALDIQGDTEDFQLTLSHPLLRSRRENILVGAGIGRNKSYSQTLGTPTRDADIDLLELSMLYNRVHDNNAISSVTAVFSTNFRSNPDGLRNNAQKAKLIVDGNYQLPLDNNWSVYLGGALALTADPLVDSEQFSIGGQGSVRGFASADVRGDSGFMVTAELQRRFNLEGTLPGYAKAFIDSGHVYRRIPIAGQEEEETLTSLGFGVSVLPASDVSIDLEYARPIDASTTSDGRDGGRVWLNITKIF